MASRRRTLIWLIAILVIGWNLFLLMRYSFPHRGPAGSGEEASPNSDANVAVLRSRLDKLQVALQTQSQLHLQLLTLLRRESTRLGSDIIRQASHLVDNQRPLQLVRRNRVPADPNTPLRPLGPNQALPVLVMACNRVTVRRSLDLLLRYRPSVSQHPIIVSQDCGHAPTDATIASYGSQLLHLRHPDLSGFSLPPSQKRFEGYYKISRHYKWAIDQVLIQRNFSAVIIVEDDLEVAPDFFSYFRATLPVLEADRSLMCVSAWNDNGKAQLIEDNPMLLHRTDFFPGLGWMLLREVWQEVRRNWPPAFWDEYIRRPEVRRERACIRPEVSRSSTFGRIGVSHGQFFDKHLKFIRLNRRAVDFEKRDMSYLRREKYDQDFEVEVYTKPEVGVDQVLSDGLSAISGPVRITYRAKDEFRSIARRLGLMDDFKAGVPRTAYRGVVSLFYRGRRVYVAPPRPWKGYNLKWT